MGTSMKKFAVIKDQVVKNIIIWDTSDAYDPIDLVVELSDEIHVDIGFLYRDGQFIDPNASTTQEQI